MQDFQLCIVASAYCEQSSTNKKPNDELSDSLKLLSELYKVKFLSKLPFKIHNL